MKLYVPLDSVAVALGADALVAAMAAALRFVDAEDPQSAELQQRLQTEDAATVTASVTGLDRAHPLFARVEEVVAARQAELRG